MLNNTFHLQRSFHSKTETTVSPLFILISFTSFLSKNATLLRNILNALRNEWIRSDLVPSFHGDIKLSKQYLPNITEPYNRKT